jgi:hypothetical protein
MRTFIIFKSRNLKPGEYELLELTAGEFLPNHFSGGYTFTLAQAQLLARLADRKGKLWVNIDGVCRLRIGKCKTAQVSWQQGPKRTFKVAFKTAEVS